MSGKKNATGAKAAGRSRKPTKRRKRVPYTLEVAPDVQAEIEHLIDVLDLKHVDPQRVICFRSRGATAKIYARIWSLPKIWQMALGVEAHYAIEVVELFDRCDAEEKTKTLIHELMHIPKTFSGALVPHVCFGKEINDETVEELYAVYRANLDEQGQSHGTSAQEHGGHPTWSPPSGTTAFTWRDASSPAAGAEAGAASSDDAEAELPPIPDREGPDPDPASTFTTCEPDVHTDVNVAAGMRQFRLDAWLAPLGKKRA